MKSKNYKIIELKIKHIIYILLFGLTLYLVTRSIGLVFAVLNLVKSPFLTYAVGIIFDIITIIPLIILPVTLLYTKFRTAKKQETFTLLSFMVDFKYLGKFLFYLFKLNNYFQENYSKNKKIALYIISIICVIIAFSLYLIVFSFINTSTIVLLVLLGLLLILLTIIDVVLIKCILGA